MKQAENVTYFVTSASFSGTRFLSINMTSDVADFVTESERYPCLDYRFWSDPFLWEIQIFLFTFSLFEFIFMIRLNISSLDMWNLYVSKNKLTMIFFQMLFYKIDKITIQRKNLNCQIHIFFQEENIIAL